VFLILIWDSKNMDKQQAKEKIEKLVKRYEKLSDAEKKRYNEQQTKDHFIRPLFEALGWDFEEEVWPETDVSGKRVDYALKIEGITKFYIEAKPISANLDEERWAEQAINYSWHKSVPWVILTDFEAIKVFNTEWDEPDIQSCRYIEIPWTEYLTNEKLWWLSREAFQKGILDKKADEVGKRPKRIIDDQLASDLIRWRELLYEDLCGYNSKINPKKVLEYVQKILDRLIFIRTLEDRKIEDIILQPLVREWEQKGGKADQLLLSLNKVFRKIDKIYDSGLFEEGPCDHLGDKLDGTDGTFAEVIEALYRTKGRGIRYNFADIPADIFGNIYEQYLGHIQQEEIKEKKTSKRKSQGIYYTPRYIVNYIIQNTLGEILKNQTPAEIKNLKILDPACGSGSFLIVAYQALLDYWEKQKGRKIKEKNGKFKDIEKAFKKRNGSIITPQEKMRILLNNIFGVDLDEEAVELAKLNLLLKMVGGKIKLPKLANNIQEGNSLISGSESELKKYFGRKWKDKKPFEWERKFDVVIGNPPWGADIDDDIKYFENHYPNSTKQHKDIYKIFIEKAMQLLKGGGIFGFIIPNTILLQPRFKDVRQFLNQYKLLHIINLGERVFEGVEAPSCVIICEKTPRQKNYKVKVFDLSFSKDNELKANELRKCKYSEIVQSDYNKSPDTAFVMQYKKLERDEVILDEVLDIKDAGINYQRVKVGMREKGKSDLAKRLLYEGQQENKSDKMYYKGEDIDRYFIKEKTKRFVKTNYKDFIKNNEVVRLNKNFYKVMPKIIWRQTADRIIATLDNRGIWFGRSIQGGILKKECENKIDLRYLLALLNSKHLNHFYIQTVKESGRVFPQVKLSKVKQLPIKIISLEKQKPFIKLADKMLKLNKKLQKLDPIMDDKEYKEIKEEIERTDEEIDERIFGIYGLGEEERNIIKKSNKK